MSQESFRSVAAMFEHRVKATPDADAFYSPDGEGGWKTYLWKDVGERVRAIAGGLRSLGVTSEERVAILAATRVEWIFCDIGVLCAGGATTTVYPSNTAEECEYILNDSGSVAIICEDASQVAKVVEKRAELPNIKHVISIDGEGGHDGWVITLGDLEEKGRAWLKENPGEYEKIVESVEPEHLATLIYTSGTTGKPKGVQLVHDCWVYTGEAMDAVHFLSPSDKQFLWLPMSHSFGKVLEVAVIKIGIPTAVDGNIPKIVENLAVVKPTFMAAAPRIFEKVYNKVVSGAQEAGGVKLAIFRWALAVGKEVSAVRQKGGEPGGLLALKSRIADKLVFSKLRNLFGGNIRFFISGSAPLSRDMAEFFHAAGLLILEGYGLTESSAASFVNLPGAYRFGTVGHPLPGTEVKLAPADGEILIKSRGIMRGYYNLPEVNAETLEDGWLLTGDIGELDADGKLRITDRKKDLIKTSGGKYVAPQHLEGKLKAIGSGLISQVLVHGNARNFCTALITLDEEFIKKWAGDNGHAGKSYEELTQLPELNAKVQTCVDELNSGLARYETVKKFALLPQDFTVETGELTPSLKVKRKVVETRYKALLDGFYEGALKAV
jgi:long-chain acyl-CoA synthetase